MCGIVAYIGHRRAMPVLIKGLKRLEYRGYDSAGVGVVENEKEARRDEVRIVKKLGKVAVLEAATEAMTTDATLGIAHTRWATHGAPSEKNSHPHANATGSLCVVHNGIVENYVTLKRQLQKKGYAFRSETDTEVLAHLIHDMQKTHGVTLVEAVRLSLPRVEGTFGLAVVSAKDPDTLIGARKGSPLIVGVGKGEYFLASDASAIVEYTSDVIYLKEGDVVTLSRNTHEIHSLAAVLAASSSTESKFVTKARTKSTGGNPMRAKARRRTSFVIEHLEISRAEIEKGGHKFFMIKEILDQPRTLANCMRGRVSGLLHATMQVSLGRGAEMAGPEAKRSHDGPETKKARAPLRRRTTRVFSPPAASPSVRTERGPCGALGRKTGSGIALPELEGAVMRKLLAAKRFVICACGTSRHAGLVGGYLLESLARTSVKVEYANEFRYKKPVLFADSDVVIVASQSGETADTLAAVAEAKRQGVLTVGIVNVVGSTIARETDAVIYLHAGPEIGVASTKAFTAQVIVFSMLALLLGRRKGNLSVEDYERHVEALARVPAQIARMLASEEGTSDILAASAAFRDAHSMLFLGRGFNFPVALEGALKLKEISYIHAEGYPAAELKHGPIALVDAAMPVVIIAPRSDSHYSKIRANAEEVAARQGTLIVLTEASNHDFDDLAAHVIGIPETEEYFTPLLAVVPLQLISYHIADMRGLDVDRPRNLAKSVTVE